jgi:hypothetical protein
VLGTSLQLDVVVVAGAAAGPARRAATVTRLAARARVERGIGLVIDLERPGLEREPAERS